MPRNGPEVPPATLAGVGAGNARSKLARAGQSVIVVGNLAESLLRFRGSLMREMVARGFRVVGCAPHIGSSVRAGLADMGVESREVPLRRGAARPLDDLRFMLSLFRIIREERPGLVLTYTIKPVILGSLVARMAGVPRSASIIAGLGSSFAAASAGQAAGSRVVRALYRLALAKTQAVVFQNQDDQALFHSLGLVRPGCRTVVVGGSGIDLEEFSPAPPPNGPCFLMASRLIADKGVREYCAAAALVRQRHPRARFRLAGWIDERQPSAITASQLDEWTAMAGVEYVGHVADVRPLLRECSAFVLPSYYREGVPRSLLEALAVGRAIVSTDMPGCREAVVSGETGLLVPPRDVPALAAALSRLVEDPALAEAMGRAGRRLAESRFDARLVNEDILRAVLPPSEAS